MKKHLCYRKTPGSKKFLSNNENYAEFYKGRNEFQKNIIKWLRLIICLPAILIYCAVIPFGGEISLILIISPGVIMITNWLCSTILIRNKKYHYLCPYYLTFQNNLFTFLSIQSISYVTDEKTFFGFILGVEVSLIFCLLLISKLPINNVLYSYSLFSAHIIWRAAIKDLTWVNIAFFISIIIFQIYLYWRFEKLDYEVFCKLQKSQKGLLQFKRLIENFPNPIIIFNKESYEKKKGLYMNEEARTLSQNLDLATLLNKFSLVEMDVEENNTVGPKFILGERIRSLFNEDKKSFNRYISTYNNFQGITELTNPNNLFFEREKSDSAEAVLTQEIINLDSKVKYEVTLGPIEWVSDRDKEEDAFIIIFNDVSEREKIHKLKLLHENKDRLLATVSHELRTPLNGIIGMLDIADEKNLDGKIKKYLSIAKNSAKILLLMISDILDTSQIEKGVLKLNIENINIWRVLDDVLPLMRVQMKKKGLRLNYINKCEEQVTVKADKNRLQQIIFNLLSNAHKFTERGEISVKVYQGGEIMEPEERGFNNESLPLTAQDEITISVSDTGRGIKQETIPHLFKLFGKFEVSGNETGVGLGLAISQKLARQMSEKGIQVRSEYAKGSEFWITLKRGEDEVLLLESPHIKGHTTLQNNLVIKPSKISRTECEIGSTKFKLILVVDDDQINHTVIGKYLLQ